MSKMSFSITILILVKNTSLSDRLSRLSQKLVEVKFISNTEVFYSSKGFPLVLRKDQISKPAQLKDKAVYAANFGKKDTARETKIMNLARSENLQYKKGQNPKSDNL